MSKAVKPLRVATENRKGSLHPKVDDVLLGTCRAIGPDMPATHFELFFYVYSQFQDCMFCIFHSYSYSEQSLTIRCSQASLTVHITYTLWNFGQRKRMNIDTISKDIPKRPMFDDGMLEDIADMAEGCKGPGRQGQRCINVAAIANPKF